MSILTKLLLRSNPARSNLAPARWTSLSSQVTASLPVSATAHVICGTRTICSSEYMPEVVPSETYEIVGLAVRKKPNKPNQRNGYCMSVSAMLLCRVIKAAAKKGTLLQAGAKNANLAIAKTDNHLGSKATQNYLFSQLEGGDKSGYFEKAGLNIDFLGGGTYNNRIVAADKILNKKMIFRFTPSQSVVFKSRLASKKDLSSYQENIYRIQYYFRNGILKFHGLWFGELVEETHVICQYNDIRKEPHKSIIQQDLQHIRKFSESEKSEMLNRWNDWAEGEDPFRFHASQRVKHAIGPDDSPLIDNYYSRALEFSKVFSHDIFMELFREEGYTWDGFYESEKLIQAIKKKTGITPRITFKEHQEYGVVPDGVSFITDESKSFIDHPDQNVHYPSFSFGCESSV